MNTSSKLKVVVFGSINIDIFIKLNRQPLVGETMMADTVKTGYGGKVNQPTISHKIQGANQAVCCSRLNADTTLLGQIG